MPENQPGKGIGHFMGAMRIDAFRTSDAFKRDMDLWISRFRNATPVNPATPVMIPGDPEREMTSVRMTGGIPLLQVVQDDLQAIADKFSIKF
jgi:LDH2 family malate/lactate/ureidoglycolate dehydrogenase